MATFTRVCLVPLIISTLTSNSVAQHAEHRGALRRGEYGGAAYYQRQRRGSGGELLVPPGEIRTYSGGSAESNQGAFALE